MKRRLVLDTNFVVSGLLTPRGASASILRLALSNLVQVAYDSRILSEYRDVCHRPKFGFDPEAVDVIIGALAENGLRAPATPLPHALPDPDDEPFLEVALAVGKDVVLVTGDTKHFPESARGGVAVLTPRAWIEQWRIDSRRQ